MMKKLLILPLFLLLTVVVTAQDSTLNMSLLYNWKVDTLPATRGIRYNDVWGYTDCDNREYAIVGSASYVHFLEVTDPNTAHEIAAFAGGENTVWRDMKTYRDRAYAVSDGTSEGLMIFDLSGLPDTVVKTYHSNQFFNNAHNIFIDEDHARLYAVGNNVANMVVLDISSPDQPVLLANVTLTDAGNAHDVYVRDNIAYVSHEWRGFFAWDMTDPNNPLLIGGVETGNYNHSSWLTDDGRYAIYAEEVPTGLPLGIIDMEAAGGFEVINRFKFPLLAPAETGNTPHNPFIRGKYAIVSYYEDGLQIFDIEDVMNPKQVAFYDSHENDVYNGYHGNWGTYPFLPSGNILISDISRGLMVLSADSIELAPYFAGTPDATLSTDGPDSFCEGESRKLSLPANAKSFAWYKDNQLLDEEKNELVVDESGTYYGVATNGHCSAVSTPVEISVKAKPDLSELPAGDTTLCPDEGILMNGPNGMDFYIWTRNGDVLPNQGSSFYVQSSGSYQLLAYLNGCSTVSELLEITVEETPEFEVDVESTTTCFGEGDSLFLTAFPETLRYDWSVNNDPFALDTNQVVIIYNATEIITYSASSENCNFEPVDLTINAPVPAVPDITQSGDTLFSTSAVTYQWYKDSTLIVDATTSFFVPESSGTYYVETTDVNGCVAYSDEVTIIISSSEALQLLAATTISPNPFSDELTIQIANSLVGSQISLDLYANDGRLLVSKNVDNSREQIRLDLAALHAGFYWLNIKDSDGNQMTKKVVKM